MTACGLKTLTSHCIPILCIMIRSPRSLLSWGRLSLFRTVARSILREDGMIRWTTPLFCLISLRLNRVRRSWSVTLSFITGIRVWERSMGIWVWSIRPSMWRCKANMVIIMNRPDMLLQPTVPASLNIRKVTPCFCMPIRCRWWRLTPFTGRSRLITAYVSIGPICKAYVTPCSSIRAILYYICIRNRFSGTNNINCMAIRSLFIWMTARSNMPM